MMKKAFMIIILAAFVVCAVALAQQRKAIDETGFGSAEIHQTRPRAMEPSGILVIPRHINYQGYLTDDASDPINDTLSMTFRIYTASAGGSELWNENHPAVEIDEGLFNEVLGVTDPIPDSVFALGQSRWLELAVEAQTMSPRTEITSVGYAYRAVITDNADEADMVDGFHASASPNPDDLFPLSYGDTEYVNEGQVDAITGSMIQDGEVATMDLANNAVVTQKIMNNAVTSEKIATDAVTSQEISDGTILTADADPTFKAPYSDTADYALEAPADSDWVISGNYMYPALPGSIGIGTTTPVSRLHIIDSGDNIFKVNSTTNLAGIHIASGGAAANGWSIRTNGPVPSRLEFHDVVTSQTQMIIDNSGNVGINTMVPGARLHVSGNARVDGSLQVNGPTQLNGNLTVGGKVASLGGYDPPYVLYDNETRKAIRERVAREVPEEKSDGAVLFWNGETSQFEVYLPATGEFRDLVGNALATR